VGEKSENKAMERVATIVNRKQEAERDLAYWLAQPMSARIAAVEVLRQTAWQQAAKDGNQADAEPRLQRVCRIAPRQGR
jgi:hypothetical protein